MSHIFWDKNLWSVHNLKNLEFKEFQITKKAEVQRSVCDAFEEVVVEGEGDYPRKVYDIS